MVASCILDQHYQTASHAEHSIENCYRMHTNIQHMHDETLTLSIHKHLQLHASQYKQKTQHPSHPLHKHRTYLNTRRLKHYLQQWALHNNLPTDPHTVTTTDIKRNMRHIHTSIVSRHLVTRGNNKILRTAPPHISRSEEILSRLTYRPLVQLRTNNSPFSNHTYTKSMPNHIHHHSSPFVIPTYTSSLQLHPHVHPVVAPGFVDRPCPSDSTAGQMDGDADWWTTCEKIGLPPPH